MDGLHKNAQEEPWTEEILFTESLSLINARAVKMIYNLDCMHKISIVLFHFESAAAVADAYLSMLLLLLLLLLLHVVMMLHQLL